MDESGVRLLLEKALAEAIDMIEELALQGMPLHNGEYSDGAISTYEDAADYLASVRPDVWEVTRHGMRRLAS